uniref:Speckle-type POZ protein (inferred by orthology to a human protein) n=1 Tax=Strongyloides papillosus TaxID=174720 RepID=A0A0N5B2C3_STREA
MSSINSSAESDGQFSAKKSIERDNFIWTLKNFSLCGLKKTRKTSSLIFKSKKNITMKWRLLMFPKALISKDENYISLSLYLEDFDCIELKVLCSFYILSVDGRKKHIKVMKIEKLNKTSKVCYCDKYIEHGLLQSNDNELLPNGDLTVGCEIFYYCDRVNTAGFSKKSEINESVNVLLNDIAGMCESPKFSDCIINAEGCQFNVHRCILASRSEVFDSMLSDKQYEPIPTIIEINGFSSEVVDEMVRYLYTGTSPNMDEDDMAYEMLEIAEKYNLKRLKFMAEESLLYNLSIEDACRCLVHSELHSSGFLKEWCLRFIYLNAENIVNTEEWKEVVNNHPSLVARLFNIAVNIDD